MSLVPRLKLKKFPSGPSLLIAVIAGAAVITLIHRNQVRDIIASGDVARAMRSHHKSKHKGRSHKKHGHSHSRKHSKSHNSSSDGGGDGSGDSGSSSDGGGDNQGSSTDNSGGMANNQDLSSLLQQAGLPANFLQNLPQAGQNIGQGGTGLLGGTGVDLSQLQNQMPDLSQLQNQIPNLGGQINFDNITSDGSTTPQSFTPPPPPPGYPYQLPQSFIDQEGGTTPWDRDYSGYYHHTDNNGGLLGGILGPGGLVGNILGGIFGSPAPEPEPPDIHYYPQYIPPPPPPPPPYQGGYAPSMNYDYGWNVDDTSNQAGGYNPGYQYPQDPYANPYSYGGVGGFQDPYANQPPPPPPYGYPPQDPYTNMNYSPYSNPVDPYSSPYDITNSGTGYPNTAPPIYPQQAVDPTTGLPIPGVSGQGQGPLYPNPYDYGMQSQYGTDYPTNFDQNMYGNPQFPTYGVV